jgi:hypothetical protein
MNSNGKKARKKILFIVGTMNTVTQHHQVSEFLKDDYDIAFAPMYADGILDVIARSGFTDFVPLAGPVKEQAEKYMNENGLRIDHYGSDNDYDLVVTCTDLIMPKNILDKKIIHVQEGMTDPENFRYYAAKYLGLPRFVASTAMMGMSGQYDYFCVASDGYAELFEEKGVKPEKIKVTGIPNYDNCARYYNNDFPHKDYVLVATSDYRECLKYENRKKTIENAVKIADGRQMIFKLHPNELHSRAEREVKKWAPEGTIIYKDGNVHEMIANCDVLVTKYSTVVYTGIALGKEVYSDVDIDILKQLSPLQNGGKSAENIAELCRELIESPVKSDHRKKAALAGAGS